MFGPNMLTNEDVRQFISFACERCGVKGQEGKIRFEWNHRYTRRMGCAYGSHLIKLSIPLFLRASREEQRNTVIHETCHCIASALYGNVGHGYQWKRLMVMCGLPPARCHNVDRTGLKRQMRKAEYRCGCSTYNLSMIRHAHARKGRKQYFCKKCGFVISFTGILQNA